MNWTEEYQALLSDSAGMHEANDCSVVAVAALADISYNEAWQLLANRGRKPRQPPTVQNVLDVVETDLNGRLVRLRPRAVISQYYPAGHRRLQHVTTHHPERFPGVWRDGRRYLFFLRNHVLAVVNGEVHDWTRGRYKRVFRIYEVSFAHNA